MIIIAKLINIFPVVFYPFINIFILFILGLGLTYLLVPKYFRPYILWLSPWTTIITSIFYFVVMGLVGFSVNQTYVPFIIALIVINIYVLTKVKPTFNLNIKENLILAIVVGLTLILNLSPLIRHDRTLTSISMGNNDIIAYATAGDYLKDHSIAASLKPGTEEAVSNLLGGFRRWGTAIINSFFLTILNLQAYQYTYASQAVLFSLFLPLAYILFKVLSGRSNISGLIAVTIFTGFNANLLYMIYHDFFGQVLSWGIEMLFFIFLYHYFNSPRIRLNKFNRYDFILGIIIAVLYFSYHEQAVFMFAPLIIFLSAAFFLEKNNFKHYLYALLRIASISLITGFNSIIYATVFDYRRAFVTNPNQPIGWQLFRSQIPYANPFEAMGFWSIHNFAPLPAILAVVLSAVILFIFIKGIIKSRSKILTISYLLIFLLFFYWTGVYQHNFFAYNRVLTFTLPFFIVIFSIGLINLFKRQNYFSFIIIAVLIALELWSAIRLNRRFIREHLSVEKSYISILDLKKKKIKEPIYAESITYTGMPLWMSIWTNYFLYSKGTSTVPTIFDNNQFSNKIPDNDLVLITKPTPWYRSTQVILTDIVWENEYYKLGRLCNSADCLMGRTEDLSAIEMGKNNYEDSLLISGWAIKEADSRWAVGKESKLRLVVKNENNRELIIEASTIKEPQAVSVFVDNEPVGKQDIDTSFREYRYILEVPLSPGVHNIRFEYPNVYRPVDYGLSPDTRELSVNFKTIKLE